ncbi:copper resistance CopC family protein [Plantactinospora sp. B5E13]|uniref:copper resistance CopC family protein n=1 Tax=unclassified Plantactinospora TaxID=2631981 RepID=UPI00325C742D
MRVRLLSARRPLAGLLALALTAAAAVLLTPAPPAAAHGTLAMSNPAEGASVSTPLSEVELYFTERPASYAYFTVTGPDGGRLDGSWRHGEPKQLAKPVTEYLLVDGKFEPQHYTVGFPAVVLVTHWPAAGQYTVNYFTVASDGDTVRGTLRFRYTGPGGEVPQGWSPPTNQPAPELLAAAEGHGQPATGQTGDAVVPASTPPAVPPAAVGGGDDGFDWPLAAAWLVALVAVAAAFVGWRRWGAPATGRAGGVRPSRSGSGGRSRPGRRGPAGSGGVPRSGGAGTRTVPKTTAKLVTPAAGKVNPAAKPVTPAAEPVTGKVTPAPGKTPTTSTGTTGVADRDPPVRRGVTAGGTNRTVVVAGLLVLALVGGFGLGRTTAGEARPAPTAPTGDPGPVALPGQHAHAPGTGAHSHPGEGPAEAGGLAVSDAGYTLEPGRRSQEAGRAADYTFWIIGPDRQPATRYAVVHDKPLHLVVVRRDLTGFQHVHPEMAPDGRWTVSLDLPEPGAYRVYADFTVITPDGTNLPLVLGVDHQAPGAARPADLPAPQTQATTGPYVVTVDGAPQLGVSTPLLFRISRDGTPVTDQLQRHLGAYGHLVVIREGDLGYVHVHPEPELSGGAVSFWLTAPSVGRYRAFLEFRSDDTVRTAEFTFVLTG